MSLAAAETYIGGLFQALAWTTAAPTPDPPAARPQVAIIQREDHAVPDAAVLSYGHAELAARIAAALGDLGEVDVEDVIQLLRERAGFRWYLPLRRSGVVRARIPGADGTQQVAAFLVQDRTAEGGWGVRVCSHRLD